MIRLSIAVPAGDEWIVKALDNLRHQGQQDGPTPSVGAIVRSILARELQAFRPPDPEDLELAAKRASGYGESDPWID